MSTVIASGGNASGGSASGGNAHGGSALNAEAGAAGAAGGETHSSGWEPMAPSPLTPREYHTAVWTGDDSGNGKVMIWGGYPQTSSLASQLDDGALYDPRLDSWSVVTRANAPTAHPTAALVWTGTRVLAWGGDGAAPGDPWGAYDPSTDVWEQLPRCPFSNLETIHPSATWTGKYLLILNNGVGARYDVAAAQWTAMSSNGLPSTSENAAVWTGSTWIIWGGLGRTGMPSNAGAEYDPVSDQWTALPSTGAPSPRLYPVGAWTGTQMLIWGGGDGNGNFVDTNLLYAYDPNTRQWTSHVADGPPEFALGFPTVTAGQTLLVWTGFASADQPAPFGHALDWTTWSWSPIPILNQPSPRIYQSATWTGRELIVWGGSDSNKTLNDGARYTP